MPRRMSVRAERMNFINLGGTAGYMSCPFHGGQDFLYIKKEGKGNETMDRLDHRWRGPHERTVPDEHKYERMKGSIPMKKLLSVLLAIGLLASLVSVSFAENEVKIGIVQYVSHPSLDNCCDGIMQALMGAEGASDFVIDRQIGSDSSPDSDCAAFAANMVARKYDLIFAIATPAAISAFAATEGTDIPVVFCAVSDPVAVELVASLEEPGDLCSGTSDVLDLSAQLNLIQAIQPNVTTIGILYTTSEANSISQLRALKALAAERGITVDAVGIQNDADIPSAAAALCARVDCVNNFTDNKVVNNLSVLLEAAGEAGIPVYGSEVEQVKNGCLASMSIDYVALGRVTGEMALSVLAGAAIAEMPVRTISEATPVINARVMEELGLAMPEGYADAEIVS